MILSWLPIITNGKFCTFSRALYTALSPSLLMKLFLELHRLCIAAAIVAFIMICSSGKKWLINVLQNSNWKWKEKLVFYITVGYFPMCFSVKFSCISLVCLPSHAAVCLRLHWMNEHEWSPRKCLFTRFPLFTAVKKKSLKMWIKQLLQG